MNGFGDKKIGKLRCVSFQLVFSKSNILRWLSIRMKHSLITVVIKKTTNDYEDVEKTLLHRTIKTCSMPKIRTVFPRGRFVSSPWPIFDHPANAKPRSAWGDDGMKERKKKESRTGRKPRWGGECWVKKERGLERERRGERIPVWNRSAHQKRRVVSLRSERKEPRSERGVR